MDSGTGFNPTELEDAANLDAAAASETVQRALAEPLGGADGAARDRAAVHTILDHRGSSAILDSIPLDLLIALVDRWLDRLDAAGPDPDVESRRGAWDVLDVVRRSPVLQRIPEEDVPAWSARTLDLVERSHFTVGPMFRQRVETYGAKVLFEIPSAVGHRTLHWRQVSLRVDAIARGLLALDPDGEPAPVALLSDNRLEMALVDLACLTSGTFNVMIPANSTESDVGYMLRHSKVRTVVASNDVQLRKVLAAREDCPDLRHVVVMTPPPECPRGVVTLDEVSARAGSMPSEAAWERALRVRIDDRASVMYTSGTTGMPKGIVFTQRNVVFKRFARALALPEIGDRDVFLCYLPLFHTFGRFLELLGSVFWGAKYCFLENPSVEALVRGMRRFLPTVFISVPKKWMQLYDAVKVRADPMDAPDDEIADAVREVTGGRLRWGLSAAGHLNSEIFRFFQSQGIELMSGFGMTEATGGITMTRPGGYKDDSLGGALPGIELHLADDGELLIRGPYVMAGYLDPPDGEASFDDDGWFATGDLMEPDRDGDIRLIDRKKEIYKNIKGETIAPQRVENLFRDFDAVDMVFLVGDHREYNTALIHLNPETSDIDVAASSPEELKQYVRSLVISVNRFLSPYERIVDFAIVDRGLDEERGELTPKGSPRRMTVERNFQDVIDRLYRRSVLHIDGLDVLIPNWLFQALGLTSQDLQVDHGRLQLPDQPEGLRVARLGDDLAQIGSCVYRHRPGTVNLGSILSSPTMWLGNDDLVRFVGIDLSSRTRPRRSGETLGYAGHAETFEPRPRARTALETALERDEWTLPDVHLAATLLASRDEGESLRGIDLLERVVQRESPLTLAALHVLTRAARSRSSAVRRRAFRVLVPAERDARFRDTLRRFLDHAEVLVDDDTAEALCDTTLSDRKLTAFIDETLRLLEDGGRGAAQDEETGQLLGFLARYGAYHPTTFQRLRTFLARAVVLAGEGLHERAEQARESLLQGFRRWLGPNAKIAVDPETGQEYRWRDVIVFDDGVDPSDRERIYSAVVATPMLREAVFLFTGGATTRLSDIPPRGIWIRKLGENHGKVVYRLTAQTRYQGAYDIAINVNHDHPAAEVQDEIHWLILCGGTPDRTKLVEDFGGYWPLQDLWTEEFIPGATLERSMRQLSRVDDGGRRLRLTWPFLAWSTLSAYVDFWNRTARRFEIADPGPRNVVVATDDYRTGARLVSVTSRREHDGLREMLYRLRDQTITPAEAEYPDVRGLAGWDLVMSSVLEVVGEAEGTRLLESMLEETGDDHEELTAAARAYLDRTREDGFLPMRQHFAIERYLRWSAQNVDATSQARARTVQELYDTYGLQRLLKVYPETRVRFFRNTVFADSSPALAEGLDEVIAGLRNGSLAGDALIDAIADLRSRLTLEPDEDYFLARLSFPHLRPEDAASFVDVDFAGRPQSEIVVMMEDRDGARFRMRHALNPREVGRLYRLFLAAHVDVRFRMEHHYLVAINERGQVIAGIFYELEDDGSNAHLEKIVVADAYRRKGVADALMNELFNRLKAAGYRTVTTGFFRPEYFYAYGFRIERKFAGLVRDLVPDDA